MKNLKLTWPKANFKPFETEFLKFWQKLPPYQRIYLGLLFPVAILLPLLAFTYLTFWGGRLPEMYFGEPVTPTLPTHKVFVSSKTYRGNLGGLAGADQKCQELAEAVGLEGTFRAWLSNSKTDARSRIPDARYVLVNGSQVAENQADLLDRNLERAINRDENGIVTRAGVWTGTKPNGEKYTSQAGRLCGDWESSSKSMRGTVGSSRYNNYRWTENNTRTRCDKKRWLYCFQVSTPIVPIPTPTPISSTGPFSLSLSNNQTTLTCQLGDLNCYYQTVLIAKNEIDEPLYNTTMFQSSPDDIMSFIGFDGQWTSGRSITDRVIYPGQEAVNTLVKVVPLQKLGKTYSTFYIDGQTCNTDVGQPDCYFYGASQFTVTIKMVENLTPTPTFIPVLTPTPTLVPGVYKRVFITSKTYNANLGGLSGADANCQERANAAKLGGTWKAWLSSTSVSASDRLNHSENPYRRLDGVLVANNWADLTDGKIENPIKVDEYGVSWSASRFFAMVWTNTNYDGSIFSTRSDCKDWTSDSRLTGNALSGIFTYTDMQWTTNGSSPCSVANANRLYCFEQ